MNYNPYAAPAAAPGGPQGPAPTADNSPQFWGPSEAISGGWERFKPHGLILSVMVFVMIMIQQVLSAIPNQILKVAIDDPQWAAALGGLSGLLVLPVTVFLEAGLRKAYLATARGQVPTFGDLFGAGRATLPLLVFQILPAIFGVAIAGVGVVAAFSMRGGESEGLIFAIFGIMALILLPVMLWYSLTFWAVPFLIVDREMGIGEAFRESSRMTNGSRANLFLYGLLSGVVALVGACACFIGTFPATAVIGVGGAIIYLRLLGQDPYLTGNFGGPGGGFGAPAGGFGAPPAGGFGAPPAGGFGAPPAGGFGGPPAGGGYGGPPAGGGFGGPPVGGGFGGPPAGGGYGGPPAGGGYGGPPPGGSGYGGPPGGGYGGPPGGGYG